MHKLISAKHIVSGFFVGLLALPVFLEKNTTNKTGGKVAGEDIDLELIMEKSIHRDGFFLLDVTEEAGVDFRHQSARLDEKIRHIEPLISSTGASVSVADFNKDGWNDFYVTNSRQDSQNALYLNERDGTFRNVAVDFGVTGNNDEMNGVSMGAVWGDYNNDGYEDMFVYKWGKPLLYRNDNGETFTEVSESAGLSLWVNSNSAIWLDFDKDGLLDLFLGGYFHESLNLWNLTTTQIMPESYEYANNGGRNYLFKNNGDGTFSDIAFQLGLTSTRWTLAAGALDITGNGYPDLIIANDYGVDELYINDNGKKFIESGKNSGIGFSPKSGMNVSFGDIHNQGLFSMYISNITEMGVLLQGNNLWVPIDNKNPPEYENQAQKRGVYAGGWSYGAQFLDINKDGYQDLYIANGFISGIKGNSYWYDYSKVSGGNKAIISDAKNWPDMKGKSQSGYQQNIIWLNNGMGFFYETSQNVSVQKTLDSRAVAYADLWNRGSLDILVANQNNRMFVYRNMTNENNNWIAFNLEGMISNHSAIGAMVQINWDAKIQSQVVSGGIGFSSQNQRRIQFGLGDSRRVEKVTVIWPSGKTTEVIDPQINMLHRIIEPT